MAIPELHTQLHNAANDMTQPAERAAFLACAGPMHVSIELAGQLGLDVPT